MEVSAGRVLGWAIISIVGLAIFVAACVGGLAGCKAFNRAQARANARNHVSITHIEIHNAQERSRIVSAEVQITEAERRKRVAEAKGLAEAQQLIDHTLTPLYVQHEAIQAQERIATSGNNNTVIYVPSGTNGTPLITQDSLGKPLSNNPLVKAAE